MSTFENNLTFARYRIRQVLGAYPSLFFPVMRLAGSQATRERLLTPDAELVIEGFPRSGNTFSLVAFEFAQNRPVNLAHHLHAPAQIIRAVQWRIPALVLIREPKDAVLSMMSFSAFPAKPLLNGYYLFYKSVLPYSHGFASATFDEITADYGCVIKKINKKFGTDFGIFEHTKENVDQCFQVIEAKAKRFTGKETVVENIVSRPSAEKENLKEKLKKSLADENLKPLLEKCRRIHEEFLAACHA